MERKRIPASPRRLRKVGQRKQRVHLRQVKYQHRLVKAILYKLLFVPESAV